MPGIAFRLIVASLFVSLAPASDGQSAPPPISLRAGFVFPVRVAKAVDTKKAKADDPVVAEMAADLHRADGTVVVPKGAKVIGRVVETCLRNGESPSKLAVLFERMDFRGSSIAFHGFIRAIGMPQHTESIEDYGMARVPAKGGSSTLPATPTNMVGSSVLSGKDLRSELDGIDIHMAEGLPRRLSVLSSTSRDVKIPNQAELIIEVSE